MVKRVLSFLLSLTILFGVVFVGAPEVSAAYDMKASEDIIDLIKKFEGFASKPYQDNGQWSVGYGTAVSGQDLKTYQERGITVKEADTLMRRYIADFETDLNNFAKKYKLSLSQRKFDALLSFTYNLGGDWVNNDSAFRQAVIDGKKGNDFIFAIARWCTASGKVLERLVERRLAEANVYLNGVYDRNPPDNYCYVLYDVNAAKPYVNDISVQGFDNKSSVTLKAKPTKTGYRFLGWYTAAQGGEWVTSLGAGTKTVTLYGHWQDVNDTDASSTGIAAKYQLKVGGSVSGIVRKTPSQDAAETSVLSEGTKVSIVADYMDLQGNKWGKLSTGGWIIVNADSQANNGFGKPIDPLKVTVLQNDVNIRTGPSTDYTKIAQVDKGTQLTITAIYDKGTYVWGLSSKGWICLKYTDYDQVLLEQGADEDKVIATGKVYRTEKLNVRSGPGTKYSKVGQLSKGDIVKITQQKDVSGYKWGKTAAGWVSMYYIQIVDDDTPATPKPDTKPETKPDEVLYTGIVTGCAELNIRKAAGTKNAKVGSIPKGTRIEILEETKVGSYPWGRIKEGWVSLNYVKKVTDDQDTKPDTPTTPSNPDNKDEKVIASGKVVNCSVLNVREGAGTKYAKVAEIKAGAKVDIYEKAKASNGKEWGRTDKGWVCMYYIKTTSTGTSSGGTTSGGSTSGGSSSGSSELETVKKLQAGKIVKTTSLTVRKGPGTKYAQVTTLKKGTPVVITETTKVGSTTWGHIDKGWISMYYVELTGEKLSEGATVRTVNTEKLNIRSAPGASNKLMGTYTKGTKILILEQKKLNGTAWGRTDKGWICMYYTK